MGYEGDAVDILLSVRVGLDIRLGLIELLGLPPKSMGIPSRMPSRFKIGVALSLLGSGRFDSRPASPCKTSKLERRSIFGVEKVVVYETGQGLMSKTSSDEGWGE